MALINRDGGMAEMERAEHCQGSPSDDTGFRRLRKPSGTLVGCQLIIECITRLSLELRVILNQSFDETAQKGNGNNEGDR